MDECVEHLPNIVVYYVTICNGISNLAFTIVATKLMKYFGKTLVIGTNNVFIICLNTLKKYIYSNMVKCWRISNACFDLDK